VAKIFAHGNAKMKKKIPKSFTLGGLDFTVKTGKVVSEGNLGHTNFLKNELVVKEFYNDVPINKQQQEQCFYHELVHAILMTMNESELNENEKFVDLFGQFLYQYNKTVKWL